MDELVQVVNTVGFPIVAYLLMSNQVNKLNSIIVELSSTLKTIDTRIERLEGGKNV